jgi:hypothetical protein
VFLAAITGALLRWLLLAVLALPRTRRLAPHPVLFQVLLTELPQTSNPVFLYCCRRV